MPVDPSYPAGRIEYLLNSSGAGTLVTESAFMFAIPFFEGNLFAIDIQLGGLTDIAESALVTPRLDAMAYMIFTSGSTGKPKGVAVSHGSLANYIGWAREYYFQHNHFGGSFPLFTSISFDLTVTSIFVPLSKGKTIEMYPDQEVATTLQGIFGPMGQADTVKLTPSHITLLAELPSSETRVRSLIVGGEALREDQVAIVKSKWPEIVVFNEYGPTEATVGCTVAAVSPEQITIGKPIDNVSIYILDHNRKLMPLGSTGDIYNRWAVPCDGLFWPASAN